MDIHDNTLYYSIPIYTQSRDDMYLFIVIRPTKYSIKLQGAENE